MVWRPRIMRPGHGHNRRVVREAFERRVAARPSDAVEHDVALADGGAELVHAETGQEDAVLCGVEAEDGEGALEPAAHAIGHPVAMHRLDEDETGSRRPARAMRAKTWSYCGRYLNSDWPHQ